MIFDNRISVKSFNPRAHAGRDERTTRSPSCMPKFQSTRPRGARPEEIYTILEQKKVSIHAPTRGATFLLFQGSPLGFGFNPRAHAGRDCTAQVLSPVQKVSIHAPTRGATQSQAMVRQADRVSIHAPTRGATATSSATDFTTTGFNPRAHAGRDIFTDPELSVTSVSIHAPTRGATRLEHLRWKVEIVSIHAPTRGATPSFLSLEARIKVSIHAPTRGATAEIKCDKTYIQVSIHAPTRGATQRRTGNRRRNPKAVRRGRAVAPR